MSIRVLYCMSCCRFHRELPDFFAPFKHFSLEMVANIYDGIVKKPAVDGSTIIRIYFDNGSQYRTHWMHIASGNLL